MKGFGTELVTVIIPPDRQVSDARQMLQNEHGQAANIKSKSTKKNVQGAIESAISSLSKYRDAGDRGIALFTGAIIVGNNKTRHITVVIDDPPQPLCPSDTAVILSLNLLNWKICSSTRNHTVLCN